VGNLTVVEEEKEEEEEGNDFPRLLGSKKGGSA